MACIICFLSDEFQENLRNISQQRAEKFEDVISEYKANFILEFDHLEPVHFCPIHNGYNDDAQKLASDYHISLKKLEGTSDFFDAIQNVYEIWIDGNIKQSIERLSEIIEEYNLLYQANKTDKRIFFKGRLSKPYLSTEEIYHIPHNKRYLISNQRYSLTGQPIIYLGLSVLDVFAELKVSKENFQDINFSSFIFKNLDETLNLFDFTSDFESSISELNYSSMLSKFLDPQSLDETNIKRKFFKFILISLCSFRRRRESENWSFCEEYVLPQLVTENAKEKKFEGILFYSTRINKSLAYSDESVYVSRYKENVALFTKYNKRENYDKTLIDKFEISKPLKYQDIIKIDSAELERIRKQINEREAKVKKQGTLAPLASYADGLTTTSFEKLMVQSFDNDSYLVYKNHPIGHMHYYLLYQILLTIRNKLTDDNNSKP